MGLLGGDCPGMGWEELTTRARGREPPERPDSPSSSRTQLLGASRRVGSSGMAGWAARGAGDRGPTPAQGNGRRDSGLAGTGPLPSTSTRGPRAGKSGRGAQRCREGQQAAEQPFPPAGTAASKTFPSLGRGVRGSTPGMRDLAGAGAQGGLAGSCPWHPKCPHTLTGGVQ